MGDWYVQAAWPTPIDRGAKNCLEQYRWDEAKSQVHVTFTFDDRKGKPGLVKQVGGVVDDSVSTTEWWVKPKVGPFYVPFRLPYLVIDVDAVDYRWLTASSPSTTGLVPWCYIMSRDKHVDEEFLAKRRAVAAAAGWDLDKAERVHHDA